MKSFIARSLWTSIGLVALATGALGCGSVLTDTTTGYTRQAESAIQDLERNFWSGTPMNGHFVPACGLLRPLFSEDGEIWMEAQAYNALYGWWKVSGDDDARTRLAANWTWVKSRHPHNDWRLCGNGTPMNAASDDTAWNAGLALQAYDITKDPDALADAEASVDAAYTRWWDSRPGGGLWYSDDHWTKSLYQATLALDAYELFRLSGQTRFLADCTETYDWIVARLQRPDGLYWCDYVGNAPLGMDRPDDIGVADSVTFLEGNMAMALLNARLYRATGEYRYAEGAIRGSMALINKQVDSAGILMDDRDCNVNGYLVRDWVDEVVPLSPALAQGVVAVRRTASVVFEADRTPYGCYGGDWSGLAASRWNLGTFGPERVVTCANAVDNLIAAASLERLSTSAGSVFCDASISDCLPGRY